MLKPKFSVLWNDEGWLKSEILTDGRQEDISVPSVMSFLGQMMCKTQLFLSEEPRPFLCLYTRSRRCIFRYWVTEERSEPGSQIKKLHIRNWMKKTSLWCWHDPLPCLWNQCLNLVHDWDWYYPPEWVLSSSQPVLEANLDRKFILAPHSSYIV